MLHDARRTMLHDELNIQKEEPTIHDEIRSWAWNGLIVICLTCLATLFIVGTYVAINRILEGEPKVLRL